jgi:phosphoglycerol transferase MdoB-like AlkP superfamily enzyme
MLYLMLIRVVLNITTGISMFNFGFLFDMIVMIFIVGFFGNIIIHKASQKTYYIIVIIFFSVILFADVVYTGYFDMLTSKSNLFGIKRLGEGNTTEYDLKLSFDIYVSMVFALLASYFIITNKKLDVFYKKDFKILFLSFIVIVVVFLIGGNHNFETKTDYYKSDVYLYETMHDSSLFSEKYGYFNYHILDLFRGSSKINEEESYDSINAYFDEKEKHVTNDYSDLYAGYNIINIVGETLETRFIDPVLTPNLYMMLNDGYSFDNFYTPVYQQGATCNTEFMSLTSINAVRSNHTINNVCDSYFDNTYTYALPNQLESIGYSTYYFHSGYEWFYRRDEINPNFGFSISKFQEDLFELGYSEFHDRLDSEMIYFLDEFVDFDELFYIDLLTYSGHGAYNQEEFNVHSDRVEEAYPGIELDSEIVNYMEKLVELDNMIGLVIDELTLHGQMDNTLFVIYPDHYPYMFDQEMYSEYIGIKEGSPEIMKQELIMYATNMTGEVISMTGSTIDIAPSILNLIDSSLNFKYYNGIDLFSNMDNYVLFSDLTITDGENYYNFNEEYSGLASEEAVLDSILEEKLEQLELQKQLLIIDYFKMLEEIEE